MAVRTGMPPATLASNKNSDIHFLAAVSGQQVIVGSDSGLVGAHHMFSVFHGLYHKRCGRLDASEHFNYNVDIRILYYIVGIFGQQSRISVRPGAFSSGCAARSGSLFQGRCSYALLDDLPVVCKDLVCSSAYIAETQQADL